MSVDLWDKIQTTFPFYTIYTLKQNLSRNDLVRKYTLSKGSAGTVIGCGKSTAKYIGSYIWGTFQKCGITSQALTLTVTPLSLYA